MKKQRCVMMDENTSKETFDIMIQVLAKNTYTGEIMVMETEGDMDWEDVRDEFTFFVTNTFNGKAKKFYTLYEAFDYKDKLWNNYRYA